MTEITEAGKNPEPLTESSILYQKPFPKETPLKGIEEEGPSHEGKFRGAMDFLVDLGTPVLAPADGEVVNIVDNHDRYGSSPEFVDDLNYMTLKHVTEHGVEFSQVAHLAKGSAAGIKPGDRVKAGQQLAVSGNSGWITEPHIHMFVFGTFQTVDRFGRLIGTDFKGKKIKFAPEKPEQTSGEQT